MMFSLILSAKRNIQPNAVSWISGWNKSSESLGYISSIEGDDKNQQYLEMISKGLDLQLAMTLHNYKQQNEVG